MNQKLSLYRRMYLVRKSETRISDEYFDDHMKTPVHLCIGAEAITAGVFEGINSPKTILGTYRNHAQYLCASEDFDGFFAEMYGKATGVCKGKAGSMHLMNPQAGLIATSAVVATTIPVAVGAALANKYQKKNDLVIVFFGDGATEEGAFYESLNFASIHKLNILFVCEDNELAIHAKPEIRRGFKSYKELVSSFNILFKEVDGVNSLSVLEGASQLYDQMQTLKQPGFLYGKYFRFLEHVGPLEDFKFGYRQKPEELRKLDPVHLLREQLIAEGLDVAGVEEEINQKIDSAIAKAKAAPFPGIEELFTDVLA